MAVKLNLDLTLTNNQNDLSDELYTDVGASIFSLEHDRFYGTPEFEIWTGPGKTGTQLTETTDFTLGGIDTGLTTDASRNVYSFVTIVNATYQAGDLYISYWVTGDVIDGTEFGDVAFRSSGTGPGQVPIVQENGQLPASVAGSSPGGAEGSIQYNSSGDLGGSENLTYDGSGKIAIAEESVQLVLGQTSTITFSGSNTWDNSVGARGGGGIG